MRPKIGFLFIGCLLLSAFSVEGAVKEEAIRYRIRGYQLQHQGYLDQAAEFYRQAIAADPNYAAPHNDLGVIFEEKGNLADAEKEYLETLRIDPSYVDAYSNLAILYEKTQQHEKMIKALQKRVFLGKLDDMETQEARAKLESVEAADKAAQQPPALTLPTKVKDISLLPVKTVSALLQKVLPSVIETKENKSAAREKVVPKEKPEEDLKRQKRGDPNEANRYRIRGYQLQHQGHLEEAVELYRQAIAADPNYAAPHNDLGVIFEEKGELEEAEQEYLKALKINPSYLDAYSNLAILYEKTQQKEKMIATLQKRVSLGRAGDIETEEARAKLESLGIIVEPVSNTPVSSLAQSIVISPVRKVSPSPKEVSLPERESKEAPREIPKEVMPESRPAVKTEIKKEIAKKETEKEAFEREKDPIEESTFLRNAGLKSQRRGELDEAIRYYRQAIKVRPNFATTYNDLGIAMEEKEFLDSAEVQYLKALSMDPTYKQALYNLAFLYLKMDKHKEARRYLEKFVQEGGFDQNSLKEARENLKLLESEEKEKEKGNAREQARRIRDVEEETQRVEEQLAFRQKALDQEEKLAHLFEQGKMAYNKKDYVSAEDFFERMLLVDSQNVLAKFYLTRMHRSVEEAKRKQQEMEIRKKEAEAHKIWKRDAAKQQEQEARRREEERRIRLAEAAKRKKEAKERKKEIRLAKAKKEIERKQSVGEKDRAAREAREKVLAEQKKVGEEKRKKEAIDLYEEAKKLYREGKLEGSLSKFEALLRLTPDHPYAARYVERIHEKQKEEKEERKAKEAAVKEAAEKRKQEIEAKRLLAKSVEAWEREKQNRRMVKMKKKDVRSQQADAKMQKLAQAYYEEGLRAWRKGEVDKAIYAYEKALSLNKNHEKAKKQLAYVKGKQAEKEAKIHRFEEERSYRKEFTKTEEARLYDRAKAAYDAKDYALAKKTLEYLLTLNPNHPFAQGDLEEVEEKTRQARQKEALTRASFKKEAQKSLEVLPQKVPGETLERAQQGPEEIEKLGHPHLQKDLLLSPEETETKAHSSMESIALGYQQKAYDLQQQNDMDGATSYYQKAMAIRPSAEAANGLGVLYEKKGWYVQAEDSYKRALSLDPRYLAAHTNLALLYERLERGEEAVRHWKIRVERGDPSDFWTQKARTHLEGASLKKSP